MRYLDLLNDILALVNSMHSLHLLRLLLILHALFVFQPIFDSSTLIVKHIANCAFFLDRIGPVLVPRASAHSRPKVRQARVRVKEVIGES